MVSICHIQCLRDEFLHDEGLLREGRPSCTDGTACTNKKKSEILSGLYPDTAPSAVDA